MSRLAAELPKGDSKDGTNGTVEVPVFEIPKTHKAAIYDAPGTISTKVVELETPEPGSGQVLVRLTHSGVVSVFDRICSVCLSLWEGDLFSSPYFFFLIVWCVIHRDKLTAPRSATPTSA